MDIKYINMLDTSLSEKPKMATKHKENIAPINIPNFITSHIRKPQHLVAV